MADLDAHPHLHSASPNLIASGADIALSLNFHFVIILENCHIMSPPAVFCGRVYDPFYKDSEWKHSCMG